MPECVGYFPLYWDLVSQEITFLFLSQIWKPLKATMQELVTKKENFWPGGLAHIFHQNQTDLSIGATGQLQAFITALGTDQELFLKAGGSERQRT